MTFTFKTKEQYLAYRAEWKSEYKKLSTDIRTLKNNRKKYTYDYSDGKTRIGVNPTYNSDAAWRASSKSSKANAMMEELAEAKLEANKQYLASKEQKAA